MGKRLQTPIELYIQYSRLKKNTHTHTRKREFSIVCCTLPVDSIKYSRNYSGNVFGVKIYVTLQKFQPRVVIEELVHEWLKILTAYVIILRKREWWKGEVVVVKTEMTG